MSVGKGDGISNNIINAEGMDELKASYVSVISLI